MRLPCRAGWPRLGCDATDACRAAGCCGSRCARSAAARRCRPACRPARCAPSSRAAAQCRPTRRTPGTSSGSTRAGFKGFAASPRICTPKAIPPRCSTCPGWSDTADMLWFAAVQSEPRQSLLLDMVRSFVHPKVISFVEPVRRPRMEKLIGRTALVTGSTPPRTRACLRYRTNRGSWSSAIRKSSSDPVSFRRRSPRELQGENCLRGAQVRGLATNLSKWALVAACTLL